MYHLQYCITLTSDIDVFNNAFIARIGCNLQDKEKDLNTINNKKISLLLNIPYSDLIMTFVEKWQ